MRHVAVLSAACAHVDHNIYCHEAGRWHSSGGLRHRYGSSRLIVLIGRVCILNNNDESHVCFCFSHCCRFEAQQGATKPYVAQCLPSWVVSNAVKGQNALSAHVCLVPCDISVAGFTGCTVQENAIICQSDNESHPNDYSSACWRHK
jgi:hypothetical protein